MIDESERDDLESYHDPEVLKLIVRGEREEHKKELAAMQDRLNALKVKVERGETPRPDAIHPDDVTEILRDGKPGADAIYARLHDGSLRVTEDVPRGLWSKPKEKISVAQLDRLPLAEWEKIWARVEKGEVEVVSES